MKAGWWAQIPGCASRVTRKKYRETLDDMGLVTFVSKGSKAHRRANKYAMPLDMGAVPMALMVSLETLDSVAQHEGIEREPLEYVALLAEHYTPRELKARYGEKTAMKIGTRAKLLGVEHPSRERSQPIDSNGPSLS